METPFWVEAWRGQDCLCLSHSCLTFTPAPLFICVFNISPTYLCVDPQMYHSTFVQWAKVGGENLNILLAEVQQWSASRWTSCVGGTENEAELYNCWGHERIFNLVTLEFILKVQHFSYNSNLNAYLCFQNLNLVLTTESQGHNTVENITWNVHQHMHCPAARQMHRFLRFEEHYSDKFIQF